MTLPNLWDNLAPKQETLEKLKKDYERGITPDLPYFIVGQQEVKEKIGGYDNALKFPDNFLKNFISKK